MMNPSIFNFLINEFLREPFYILGCGMNGVGKSFTSEIILEIMSKIEKRQIVIPSGPMDDTWHHLPLFPTEEILGEVTGLYLHNIAQLNTAKMVDKREEFFYELGVQLNAVDKAYRYPIGPNQRVLFDGLTHPTYGLMNALLICDDFKKYLHGYQEDPTVMALLGDRRHRDLDLIFMSHDPSEIPPYFLRKNPLLILWATSGNFDGAASKIKGDVMAKLQAAQDRINAKHQEGIRTGDKKLRGYCEPILIETEAE